MRAILPLAALICCATIVSAADVPPPDPHGSPVPQALTGPRGALLQLSPMYVEIRDTLAVADVREKQLLADLAVATDDAVAEAIVRELESLPLERIMSILRIQARYARLDNRPDLERQIRLRMVELRGAGNI